MAAQSSGNIVVLPRRVPDEDPSDGADGAADVAHAREDRRARHVSRDVRCAGEQLLLLIGWLDDCRGALCVQFSSSLARRPQAVDGVAVSPHHCPDVLEEAQHLSPLARCQAAGYGLLGELH